MRTRLSIAGLTIRRTTSPVVTRFLLRKLRRDQPATVFFANANFVTQCRYLRQEIAEADNVIVLNDGFALDVAARLLSGAKFPENLNGTDFTPAFLYKLESPARVFLLGGSPEVVVAAAEVFGSYPRVEVCGHADGYSLWQDENKTLEAINAARPEILLVALGNPLQEEWILRHRSTLDAPLIFAVGALFDFMSGRISRAPQALRNLHLEWAYRLFLEPRRLVGRYTIGILRFFSMALFDRTKV
jgi:beta-1,4-glucosyltransferase